MELVTVTCEEGILTLAPHDRIDTNNAGEAETLFEGALAEYPDAKVIIDAEDLNYISSAGLRVVLKVRKARPDVQIINASSEVYDIFEMTGFTEMIPVSKAYRQISVEGCEVIGEGANGKVFRIDEDTIVKQFLNPGCLDDIQRERGLARKAFVLGVPTAISYDVVKLKEGGYGAVYELIRTKSYGKLLAADPSRLDDCIRKSVDIIKIMHNTEVKPEDMPDMREVGIDWAKYLEPHLPADKYAKLVKLFEDVPVRHTMLHGDYHVKNIMQQGEEALLIDMDTLSQGNPVYEFGSIFNAYVGYHPYPQGEINTFLGIPFAMCTEFWNKTLEYYFDTTDKAVLGDYEKKAQVVGYTRALRRGLRRNHQNDPEKAKDLEFFKARLLELVDEVDSLAY